MEKGRILTQCIPHDAALKRRVVAAAGVVSLFIGVGAFGTAPESMVPPLRETVIERLAVVPTDIPAADAGHLYWHETTFERGDTFAAMLGRLGVETAETAKLVKEYAAGTPFRYLRPGMTVQAQTNDDGGLVSLRFMSPSYDSVLGFERVADRFRVIEELARPRPQIFVKAGVISSSLFAAADAMGMPDSVTQQLATIFSGEVDFHSDLRSGDRFAVIYEVLYHDGLPLRAGRVLAAEFVQVKKTQRAVWFADADGKGGYYTPEGKSLRKAFLRSPLEFSRITSGFTMRAHPILNEWRAHNGIDYGAPAGTRVKATADGVVEFAGAQNGYGNVVVLKHRGAISTLYAHLSGFAAGIRKGERVLQGDAIGFVGATGWATGPHLHYEFRVQNQHRNPLALAMPAAESVPRPLLAEFRTEVQPFLERLDLAANVTLAGLE